MAAESQTEDTFEEQIREFADELTDSGDRAAVLVAAAAIDGALEQLLEKVLRPNPGSRDDLLDGDSPLSTLSARINCCHRLGLIDDDFARTIHLLRKIRNDFAHDVTGCTFEGSSHRDRVRALADPLRRTGGFKVLNAAFQRKHPSATAAEFKAASCMLFLACLIALLRAKPLGCSSAIKLSELPDRIPSGPGVTRPESGESPAKPPASDPA